jgi:prepilin peptidase CpaA
MSLSAWIETAAPVAIPAIEWIVLLAIAAGMGWDVLRLRIPHTVCLVIAGLMPLWGLLQPVPVPWIAHLAGLLVAFAIGFVLWRLRWFGGGDVKLMSAIALWIGIGDLGFYLVAMSLLGSALAILLLGLRAAFGRLARSGPAAPAPAIALLRKGAPIPYAVAIGLAAFLLRNLLFDTA